MDPLFVGNSTNYASVAPDGVSTPPTPGPTCLGVDCGSAVTNVVGPTPPPTPTPKPGLLARKKRVISRVASVVQANQAMLDKKVAVLVDGKGVYSSLNLSEEDF